MKVRIPNLSNVTGDDFRRYASSAVYDLGSAVNGNIVLNENTSSKLVSVEFSGSGSTVSVAHGLGRIPSGYIFCGGSAGIVVFDGSGDNTSETLFVQSTGAGTARIMVF